MSEKFGLSIDSASKLAESAQQKIKEIANDVKQKGGIDKESLKDPIVTLSKIVNTLNSFMDQSDSKLDSVENLKQQLKDIKDKYNILNKLILSKDPSFFDEEIEIDENEDRPSVDRINGLAGIVKNAWVNYRSSNTNLPSNFDKYFDSLNMSAKKALIEDVYESTIKGNESLSILEEDYKKVA